MERAAELLMPAGSLEKLKVAILYGADAVYMGTPDLSLRTRSNRSTKFWKASPSPTPVASAPI